MAQSGVDRVDWAQAPLWAPATQAQQALHLPHLLGAGEGGVGTPDWAGIVLTIRPPATSSHQGAGGRQCLASELLLPTWTALVHHLRLCHPPPGGPGQVLDLGQGVKGAFAETRLSPPQKAQHPLEAVLTQCAVQDRGLTSLQAPGCPVAEMPTLKARILDCGSGLTTPKTFPFLLPLLLPRLGWGTEDGHRGRGRRGEGSACHYLTCFRRSLPRRARPRT